MLINEQHNDEWKLKEVILKDHSTYIPLKSKDRSIDNLMQKYTRQKAEHTTRKFWILEFLIYLPESIQVHCDPASDPDAEELSLSESAKVR